MSGDEVAYYQRRAEDEIELAQRASHSRAVQAHYHLASAYLDRIHGEAPISAPNFLTA
ncbi:MAG TPA: hypothetical protein VF631_02300 [Allosphingosinicella sp.]|jgi:hypothetical protein|uniref:hypothetical protein n=1 Tax=Allosphingosinicella sp. TaxID=2823234 RepID=UPI002F297E6D